MSNLPGIYLPRNMEQEVDTKRIMLMAAFSLKNAIFILLRSCGVMTLLWMIRSTNVTAMPKKYAQFRPAAKPVAINAANATR
jgi:hypothetical protein